MAQILYGTVDKNGNKLGGDGYLVDHTLTGIYTIVFGTPFKGVPGAASTQIFHNSIDSPGGITLDNAVIIYVDSEILKLKMGDSNGHPSNRDFSFIVFGEPQTD